MINKFKNALKVGKKNKDLDQGVAIDETIDSGIEVSEGEETNVDSDKDVEEIDLEVGEEESPSEEKEEMSEEETFEEGSDDSLADPVESCYKIEASKDKTVQDAGIPVEEHNLQELVCSTLKQFAPIIIKKGIRLELDGLDTVITTNDEVALFIFQEILSNAINSLKEGSVKISLNDNKLIFEDTGYGIPADEVSMIFNEGFMASNAEPSDDVEGMGMYKCSIALEKMNYGYEIKSTQGKGTIFIIDLSQ